MKISALLLVLLRAANSVREAKNENTMIFEPGGVPCGKWTAEPQNSPSRGIQEAWLFGFVSAYCIYSKNDQDIIAPDGKVLVVWVNRYCSSHPLDKLATAAIQLIEELRKRLAMPA